MKQILDHDPLTGITTYFETTPDEKMHITEVQDVTPILDDTQALRNDADYSRAGIKNDMWHYARIPLVVLLEIKQKYGLDMMKGKPDWKSFFKIINRDYPYLKATDKTHA